MDAPNLKAVPDPSQYQDLDGKMTAVLISQSEMARDVKHLVEHGSDHEKRIRALERWRYALPPTIILAIVTNIITVVQLMTKP